MSSAYRVYFCKGCQEGYVVSAADENIHLLKKQMRCPNAAGCGGKQIQSRKNTVDQKKLVQITALHLYQACMGVGLPGERKCSVSEMRKLLIGAQIVGIDFEPAPDPNRSIIRSLQLDNGKAVHLAASSLGATFYKVTDWERKHGS